MRNEVFLSDPNAGALTDLVKRGFAVAFVGSGLSSGLYPSWPQLVEMVCAECGVQLPLKLNRDTPVKLLTEYADRAFARDAKKFKQVLTAVFCKPLPDDGGIYDLLMGIPFKSIVTINFDPLLAERLRKPEHQKKRLLSYPSLDVLALAYQNVFYVHGYIPVEGDFNLSHIVLTRSIFDLAYDEFRSKLPLFWQALLTECPVVFLGCGLRELEVQIVLDACRKLRKHLQSEHGLPIPPLYILRPSCGVGQDRDLAREQQEHDEMLCQELTIVRYDKRDDGHSGLRDILDAWNPQRSINTYKAEYDGRGPNE